MPARFKDICLDATDHQGWCLAMGHVRRDNIEPPRDVRPVQRRRDDGIDVLLDPQGNEFFAPR